MHPCTEHSHLPLRPSTQSPGTSFTAKKKKKSADNHCMAAIKYFFLVVVQSFAAQILVFSFPSFFHTQGGGQKEKLLGKVSSNFLLPSCGHLDFFNSNTTLDFPTQTWKPHPIHLGLLKLWGRSRQQGGSPTGPKVAFFLVFTM